MVIIVSIFSVVIAYFLGRSVSRPLKEMTDGIQKISDGGYEVRLPEIFQDELTRCSKQLFPCGIR